jgi:HK97 family phage major capsid protein
MRQHIIGLNEVRLRLHKQAKDITDRAARERRDLDTLEQAEFDRLLDRITEIDSERDTFAAREQRETEDAALREMHPNVFGSGSRRPDPKADADYMKRWLTGDPSTPKTLTLPMAQLHEERRLLRDGASPEEIRALVWDTGSVASGVPTTTARQLHGYLEAEMGVFAAPTTKIFTDSGDAMKFPKLAAHAIGTQVIAQGTAIGGTDPTFAALQLDAYKYGSLVQVSSETLADTAFSMEAYLAQDMARAISRVLGPDLVVGTGTGEPNGVMVAGGTGTAGTVATGGTLITPTYENLVDVVYSVNNAYRNSATVHGSCATRPRASSASFAVEAARSVCRSGSRR